MERAVGWGKLLPTAFFMNEDFTIQNMDELRQLIEQLRGYKPVVAPDYLRMIAETGLGTDSMTNKNGEA